MRIVIYEWLVVGLGLLYVAASVYYYTSYSELIQSWPTDLRFLLIAAIAIGGLPIIVLVSVCEHSRSLAAFQLALTEKTFDIRSAVHDALCEFLGDALPEYSQHLHLPTFGRSASDSKRNVTQLRTSICGDTTGTHNY